MITIQEFNIKSLTKSDQFGFLNNVRTKLHECFKTLPTFCAPLIQSIDELDLALRPEMTIVSGKDLSVLDDKVDALWVNCQAYLKAMLNHPNDEIALANAQCFEVYSQFENPTRKPYATQYAIMAHLIEALDAIDAATRSVAQFDPWLEALKQAVNDFNAMYQLGIDEKSTKVLGVVKAARQEAIDAYRVFVKALETYGVYAPSPELEQFCLCLNTLISEQKTLMKTRKTLKAKAKA